MGEYRLTGGIGILEVWNALEFDIWFKRALLAEFPGYTCSFQPPSFADFDRGVTNGVF